MSCYCCKEGLLHLLVLDALSQLEVTQQLLCLAVVYFHERKSYIYRLILARSLFYFLNVIVFLIAIEDILYP